MRRRGAWVRVCALGLTVGLQACADRPSLPVPNIASGTPNPIQISRTQIAHAVTFPPGATELEAPQVSALIAFIAANGVGPKDTILIEHDGELVGQAHAETVSAQLVAIGLRPSIVAAANLTSGVARVVVERYIAIPRTAPTGPISPVRTFRITINETLVAPTPSIWPPWWLIRKTSPWAPRWAPRSAIP